jgi:hypothetical protein
LAKAADMTAEAREALAGLDDEASADGAAKRLGGKVSPALIALAKALVVHAGGLAKATKTVGPYEGARTRRPGTSPG